MRYLVVLSLMVLLVASPASAQIAITVTGGTWSESYAGGGPGQVGNIVSATLTGTDGTNSWTISLPSAVLASFNGGSGTAADPYDTDYTVSTPPAVMTDGSRVLMFSSLTLNNQTVCTSDEVDEALIAAASVDGSQTFTLTTTGVCDAGCYSMDLTVTGEETAATATEHSGIITGGTITLTLLKMFEGTWCETFGPGGPGSAGGTLTASISGSGWMIELPNAIHQGVVSGSGTPGDPWITHYEVDANQPATVKYGSIVCTFSSLTLVNSNVSGVPLFELTASGVCDAGCYQLDLTVSGTVDPATVTSTGMCGSLCGDVSLTLLKMFEGTWCETFGPCGPGSPGGTLTASMSGSGWTIDLPNAISQGVVSGSGTPCDPWVTHYEVDPNHPATLRYGSVFCYFSSLTLVNRNVAGVPLFEVTATGVCDAGCYQLDLTVSGTVDQSTVTSTGMCGSLCGDASLTLLKMFAGTWCETFGPCGPGSAGGTLTASISGSGWTIELPNAIHQGVVSGSGTAGDPWITHYEVDANQPATVKYGSTVCYFSSLTLVNNNVSGVPLFELTASGVCDAGCYQLDLTVSGTVDPATVCSTGMCGSLCGDASLTLLKMFEGTWCETFGPCGPGSPGGTLTASMSGSGWTIELPNAIHQGVVSGSGTPGDPWVTHYQVDPTQPAMVKYGSVVCYFSSLTLVNKNVAGVPLFEVTATGVGDAECYELNLTVSGTVDQSTVTCTGMCGSLCGDASLDLLRMFEGTWCETFGPGGPGSAGGTLTASMSGSGWTINLPNAIHQGVVGGSGTADDPWITDYQVDPNQPATVQIGSRVIEFSSLTLVNKNVSGVPLFEVTTAGVSDLGCYRLNLTASGTVDPTTVTSTGMCGSLCGEGTLKVTLDVSSSAGGTVLLPGEECFLYDYGTTIEFLAQPASPLFEFAGWHGSLFSARNPESLTLYTCHNVRALFLSLLDVIYVDDDAANDPGPNDNTVSDMLEDGTPEHPFDSIQEAIEVARDGAMVVVKSGTYDESIAIEDKSITVTSIDPDGKSSPEFPVIHGRYCDTVVSVIQHFGPSEAHIPEIVGMIITGGKGAEAGGILCRNSSPIFRNCLIVGNRSLFSDGGALSCEDSNPMLINCTVVDNVGSADPGAGISCINSNLTVSNSIIWDNQPVNLLLDGNSKATITFSDVQGGYDGEGNLDADPMFVMPGHWANPANPQATQDPALPDTIWVDGDYHLMLGSPCVDAGDSSDVGAEPQPNGDRINMGVYGGTDQATVSN